MLYMTGKVAVVIKLCKVIGSPKGLDCLLQILPAQTQSELSAELE